MRSSSPLVLDLRRLAWRSGDAEFSGQKAARLPPVRRRFNTAGPCRPEIHYMLPALRRIPQVRDLIDQQTYFVVHAPARSARRRP
jgi:hypothetical protein